MSLSRLGSMAAILAGVVCTGSAMGSYVELVLSQRQAGSDAVSWFGEINISAVGIANVTGVDFSTTDGAVPVGDEWDGLSYDSEETLYWGESYAFGSLGSFSSSELQSNWWVRVNYIGGSSSVYGFTMLTGSVTESIFTGRPTITNPTHGQMGVAANAEITWTAPTGNIANALVVAEREDVPAYTNHNMEMLANTATSWTPGDISATGDQIRITYANIDASGILSALTLVSGETISWGQSDYSPLPDGTPSLVLLSTSEVTVNVPEPASVGLLLMGALLIGRRRR